MRNSLKPSNNTSGYKGVAWDKKELKWKACIRFNKILKHIGYFPTAESAHQAYCEEADRLHGEFANYG
jgi:hypothetical protein